MDKVINMTYASSLTNLCEVNSSFDTGVLRICYTGKNRNGSSISKEAIERALPTIYNCPIVCSYDIETDTLGGHDSTVVRDDEGNLKLVNLTTPIGVIPESARAWFEDYEEDDGTIHEYLYAEVLLWKRQAAYSKIKNDGVTAHSMEIKVKDGTSEKDAYRIDDFEFNAFALIGVTPCFESSALEVFSENNFKQQMSEMMRDLKETFSVNPSLLEVDNIHPQNETEGGEKELELINELAAKYSIDLDSLDFSVEGMSVEEITAKFEEIKASRESAVEEQFEEQTETTEQTDDDSDDKFNLVSDIDRELHCQLAQAEPVHDEWGEHPRYWMIDFDTELMEVYVYDEAEQCRIYGFSYTVDGDAVHVNFESKKRKKFAIVDFEGDDQAPAFAPVFEMMTMKLNELSGFEQKYNAATETINAMSTELDELRAYKSEVENAAAECAREELFSKFADLNGIEAFESLRSDCAKFDLDTIEEKCFAIRGRNTSTLNFSNQQQKAPKLPVIPAGGAGIENDEPYGGIVTKYSKKA